MSPSWCLAALLLCCAAPHALADETPPTTADEDPTAAGLSVLLRAYQQCERQPDLLSCLKLRALRALERASRADSLALLDGISLVRAGAGGGVQEEEAPAPSDPRQLDALLVDRAARFLRSHSLQLDVPRLVAQAEENHENDAGVDDPVEEARRRRGGLRRYGMLMMMGMMMKGGLMAMAYKGIAMLAGKALIVAKIALVLAAVVGLSKLVGGGGGGKTTYEIVKHPQISHAYTHSSSHDYGHGGGGGGHYETSGGGGGGGSGHGGWGRSLGGDAHTMAYAAHVPPV